MSNLILIDYKKKYIEMIYYFFGQKCSYRSIFYYKFYYLIIIISLNY